MIDKLKRLLGELNERLDAGMQASARELQMRTLKWEEVSRLPLVTQYPFPEDCEFRPFPYQDTVRDPDKMLFNELLYSHGRSIYLHHLVGDDMPCTIRANFGTVVIASLLGAEISFMPDDMPWVREFDSESTASTALDADPLDFSRGICPQVIDTYGRYMDILSEYPNVRACIDIVLPDLQGPFDTAVQLIGSKAYIGLYSDTWLLNRLMEVAARAQVGFARYLIDRGVGDISGFSFQHGVMIPGHILIRNDSATNVSASLYGEHIRPHDALVLREMSGGGIHFCGKGDHLVGSMLEIPWLRCIDFGQSYMNDMQMVYAATSEKRLPLTRVGASEEALRIGDIYKSFPMGVILMHKSASIQNACEATSTWRQLHPQVISTTS